MKNLRSLWGFKVGLTQAAVLLWLGGISSQAEIVINEWIRVGERISCSWSGGANLFQLQRRMGLEFGGWSDLRGGLTTGESISVESSGLQAFFRVVDLSAGEATVFAGGSLDDLSALSPGFTFDHLIVTGSLTLDLNTVTVLQVNHFTLTSGASIGYSYGDCDYGAAPSLTIEATGQVNLGGEIRLNGRSGTRVTSTATCNSCTGQDAGSLQITAREVRITGSIETQGGTGGTSVSEFGSSGCSGGDGGLIRMEAESIWISQASLETQGGNGGTGYVSGDPNYGADGQAGDLELLVSVYLQIKESELQVDGLAHIDAPQARIASPIVAGDLRLSVGGAMDETAPDLQVLHPRPNMSVPLDQPLTVVIHTEDSASGVKEIAVSGLGLDETYPANELIDDRLTVVIERPEPPTMLTVTVTDNEGNSSSQTVSGLKLSGDLIIPSGTTYFLSEDLDLGDAANIVVEGTLEIPRAGVVRIDAGSLTSASTGLIKARPPTEDLELAQSPTLILDLARDANLEGVVDLEGHASMAGRGYDYAQGGGHLTVMAESIQIPGSVVLDGGDGRAYAFGWPAQYIRQGGGAGGVLRLTARKSVSISGSLSVQGGDTGAGALGPCFDGGDAGQILITYGEVASLGGAQELLLSGGSTLCSSIFGDNGVLATMKKVPRPVPSDDFLAQEEVEPNGDPATAVLLELPIEAVTEVLFAFAPLEVVGSINDPDPGGLEFTQGDTSRPISDLYRLSIPVDVVLDFELEWASDADLELAIFHADTYEVVGSSLSDELPEVLPNLSLSLGDYFVGVWAFDRGSTHVPSYRLRVFPAEFP